MRFFHFLNERREKDALFVFRKLSTLHTQYEGGLSVLCHVSHAERIAEGISFRQLAPACGLALDANVGLVVFGVDKNCIK